MLPLDSGAFPAVVADAATLMIAAVLALSGAGKLASSVDMMTAMERLGVPVLLRRRAVALALPPAEIALAAGMILASGWWRLACALAAAVLLAVLLWVIVAALRRGSDVGCRCFGNLSSGRIDAATAVRNGMFVLGAALAITAGAAPAVILRLTTPPGAHAAAVGVVTAFAVLAGSAVVTMVRQRVTIVRQRAELARTRHPSPSATVGVSATIAPAVPGALGDGGVGWAADAELVDRAGITWPVGRLSPGRAVLLVFVRAGCGDCVAVARAFSDWVARIEPDVKIVVATSSTPQEVETQYPPFGDRLRYGAQEARRALGVVRLPSAVLIAADGTVGTPVADGVEEIAGLVAGIEVALEALRGATAPRG